MSLTGSSSSYIIIFEIVVFEIVKKYLSCCCRDKSASHAIKLDTDI